jgi:hypothetical protein
LPANIGTFVTLVMFVAIIPAATFAGSIAAYLMQKIFFTIAGTFVYLYLFLSVDGSFDENLGNLTEHPVAAIAAGAVVLVVVVFGWTGGKLLVGQSVCRREAEGRRAEGPPGREKGGEASGARRVRPRPASSRSRRWCRGGRSGTHIRREGRRT